MKLFKKIIFLLFICLQICFLFPGSAAALTIEDIPNPRLIDNNNWVMDLEDLLSPATEAKLNLQISQLERENGTEIAVVTVPEISPHNNYSEFATELFNYWEIGKKEKNNGVLFLVSKGDRRVEIKTGYGIVSILPNERVQKEIDREIIPEFRAGEFETGIIKGTNFLITELSGSGTINNRFKTTDLLINIVGIGGMILIFCLFAFSIINSTDNFGNYKSYNRSSINNYRDGGFTGGSSGGGGSGFGGGSSGGDGGGGGW